MSTRRSARRARPLQVRPELATSLFAARTSREFGATLRIRAVAVVPSKSPQPN